MILRLESVLQYVHIEECVTWPGKVETHVVKCEAYNRKRLYHIQECIYYSRLYFCVIIILESVTYLALLGDWNMNAKNFKDHLVTFFTDRFGSLELFTS